MTTTKPKRNKSKRAPRGARKLEKEIIRTGGFFTELSYSAGHWSKIITGEARLVFDASKNYDAIQYAISSGKPFIIQWDLSK